MANLKRIVIAVAAVLALGGPAAAQCGHAMPGEVPTRDLAVLLACVEEGDAWSAYRLGHIYMNGWGVPQNDAEAARWFMLSAELGDGNAQSILGDLYKDGLGVPQDYVLAYMWYNIGATTLSWMGGGWAVAARRGIARDMTTEQIAEAQRLTREWMAAHPN